VSREKDTAADNVEYLEQTNSYQPRNLFLYSRTEYLEARTTALFQPAPGTRGMRGKG